MNMLKTVAVAITLAVTSTSLMAEIANINVKHKTDTGRPAFITGSLGEMTRGQEISALKEILKERSDYRSNNNETFKIKRQWTDRLGKSHSQLSQTIDGLEVYGTSMVIHTNNGNSINSLGQSSSNIYAVSGKLAVSPSAPATLSRNNQNAQSQNIATELANELGNIEGKPELAYVYLPLTDETKLAWKIQVTWNNGNNDFGDDILFFDVNGGELLTRHPQMHQAKSWQTDDLNNISEGSVGPSTPRGTLLCTDNEQCFEVSAQRAHDGASSVYDYYKDTFGRNSINDSDMTVVSGVHVGVNYNNAFWYNDRMWYGDGDGSQFNDLTLAHDVIGHELTHGVTEYTAGLVYANASGALNEAWSDILGVASESYMKNNTQPDWKLGEEVMASGGALRYMNNPTQDGYSTDWYPDRIPFASVPSNSNDQGGVHGNSGIANLAFQLVVDGGTHPRNKSTAVVPSIGLNKAEQIFYRALNTYMGPSTNFAGARTATAQAANDLYGETEATAIETAWCAVGVGACPTTTTPPPTGDNELANGVAETGLATSPGQDLNYTMEVPANASSLSFVMAGGSGDADLYVKFGSAPSTNDYDCRPYQNGNNENCDITTAQAGTYYVMLRAYSAFSGVSLTGSFTEGSGGTEPELGGTDSKSNISVARRAWDYTALNIPAGMSSLTVTMSGGSGDADLYIRQGSNPTTSTYTCRSWTNGNTETCTISNPAAGTWNIGVYGYSAASGMNLNMEWNP